MATPVNHKAEDRIAAFLFQFPDDARSWAQATDELPDMYVWLTEEHNRERLAIPLYPVGRDNCHTPSEWNAKYKRAIRYALTVVSDDVKNRFCERFSEWLTVTSGDEQ